MKIQKLLYAIALVMWINNYAYCFDDQKTHPSMTDKAIQSSYLDSYLKNTLGFSDGKLTKFPSYSTDSVDRLLQKGATDEDREPSTCRASNHFHNPLKSWEQAGLSGYQGLMAMSVDAWCANTAPLWDDKKSNVLWATNFTSPSATKTSTSNDYHWDKTRDLYLKALTESSKTERETNFAKTFYGLGHVLHLLQDMAVPAHVRNDFRSHLDNFVNIGLSLPTYWTKNAFENYVELNGSKITTATPVPFQRLTDFWDTGQYRTNVNPSMMDIVMGGLAEYTNANFASDYTLLTERYPLDSPYRFPYPSQDDMTVYLEDRPYLDKWGRPVYRVYLGKTGNGETIQHFATAGRLFFKKHIPNEPVVIEDPVPYLGFDDNCHKDYADKLLPRAVGYSAGLLDYFFRGKMDMYEDTENPGTYIIENKTGEAMSGTFQLFYDDDQGNRTEIKGAEWSLDGQKTDLAASGDNSMKKGVTFVPPYPEPKDKKYMLVFKGRLGDEEGAVVGKLVDLKNFFVEDWELGFTGRYPWTKYRSYYVANVVDGYADHDSKVLELNGFLHMTLPTPVAVPDKISFDYYVRTAAEKPQISMSLNGNNYYCFFAVETVDSYPVCDERADCWFPMEFGKWVHFEVPESMLKCSNWLSEITYLTLSGENTKAYIDNIVFHY